MSSLSRQQRRAAARAARGRKEKERARAANLAADSLPPPQRPHASNWVLLLVGAGATALVVTLLIGSLSLAGVISMTPAYVLLFAAWLVTSAVIFFYDFPWRWIKENRILFAVIATFLSGIFYALVGQYEYANRPIIDRGRAILALTGFNFFKDPATHLNMINVSLANTGNAFALNVFYNIRGKVTSAELSRVQIDDYMSKLLDEIKEGEKLGTNHYQIANGSSAVVTLSDPDNQKPQAIEITDSQIQDFSNGRLDIYAFVVSRYEDDTIGGAAYWQQMTCALFFAASNFWHNCASNHIDKIEGRRFPIAK